MKRQKPAFIWGSSASFRTRVRKIVLSANFDSKKKVFPIFFPLWLQFNFDSVGTNVRKVGEKVELVMPLGSSRT